MDHGQAIGLRLSRRDEGALEEAFAAYAEVIRRYVTRFVGPAEADDVVQRTFLDVWRHAGRYDPGERFTAWLFTIARRRAIDALRTRRHPVVDVTALRDLVGEDGRELADRYADAAEVREAVGRLPDHERVVIELTYFSDLSQQEVAERLGAPLGTVKARSSRGTKRLARLMSAERAGAGRSRGDR